MLLRTVRFLLILTLVIAVFIGVGYYVVTEEHTRRHELYNLSVTLSVETAVHAALYDATRTSEAPLTQYRLVTLTPNQLLFDLALQYHTTVDAIRMANALRPDVDAGSGGETLIIPEGVQVLDPPRRFKLYKAATGDTLDWIASNYGVPLDILRKDNPVLDQRGVIPGDTVFLAELL
jgi:hypothetical protein